MPSEFPSNPRRLSFLDLYTLPSPRYSLYRHVTVLDDSYRRLSSFMPAEVLRVKTLNCDPLPPPTCVSNYDEEFFKGVEDLFAARARTRQDRAADERLLETLIPDRLFREQLQVTLSLSFPASLVLICFASGFLCGKPSSRRKISWGYRSVRTAGSTFAGGYA